ncbi:hypothetical protein PHISP_05326 [Aspergillus sp. HF37]|nr:hypothetical protein PHISP_05326 [Aspergillus sp. HF37]
MEPPVIPERTSSKGVTLRKKYSSLMPPITQATLTQRSRDVSAASDMSNLSMNSKVSDFLEQKIRLHRASIDYIRDYSDGLRHAMSSNQLRKEDYEREMMDIDRQIEPVVEELKVLNGQRRTLELDLAESYEDSGKKLKRQRVSPEPSVEFMEQAYASTVVSRVMAASKQKSRRFDQSQFRKDVIKYLNADADPEGSGRVWCHLSGWLPKQRVKAAHLVPKCLRGDELTFLFGVGEVVLSDPRNGITLLSTIEEALDSGTIVIVPVPRSDDNEVTKWKCILVDESRKKHLYDSHGDMVKRWEELDGKDLMFCSDNRPARRYLYFRYVITYLHAKRDGNKGWVNKVDNRSVFWASPGPWLEKSTLLSIGRNISGFELPPSVYEGNTFTGGAHDATEGQDILVCSRLRDAAAESTRDPDDADVESGDDDKDED